MCAMKIEINDREFEAAVRDLAAITGEPEDLVIVRAIKERLERLTHRKGREFMKQFRPMLAGLSELDPRSADEILGYNEDGFCGEGGDFSKTDVEIVPLRKPR